MRREGRGLLRWLGFGPAGAEDGNRLEAEAAPADEAVDRRDVRRRQLLNDLGSFLLFHHLEVSPFTLAIAHDVITGSDQRLACLIEERIEAHRPITLEWLEEAGRTAGRRDGSAALSALMAKLEASLEDFGRTTVEARTATKAYNSALEAHVGELAQVSKAGAVISELASIAKVMLERTREIEQQMNRSEMQTRVLRKSLAEARRKADLDHLTGLPNRRAFETVLKTEHEAARAAGEPLCVAFCDIDHFKRINDSHGHEAGDRVLKAVAKTLARISDDRCHVARHGGEEFVILFRGCTLDQAWNKLDATREAMARRRLVNRATDLPFGRITFSGGIADVLAYSSPREALKAADDALYSAKSQGRNQIVRATENGVPQAA